MYDLILQLLIFSSLGAIIFLLARALPRVSDTGQVEHSTSFFDRLLTHLPLERVDAALDSFFEKFLRKVKILVLKLDNLINHYLGRIKKTNGSFMGSSPSKDSKESFKNPEEGSGKTEV